MTFDKQQAGYIARCEEGLQNATERYFEKGSKVAEAAIYSLMNGGKRVRGTLTLAVAEMLGWDMAAAAVYAAAIEMVHAFSLIHDDLPCMDDDDMRRGKPACHIVYGEATALLAGDMLPLAAIEAIAGAPAPAPANLRAVAVLASAAGSRGMIYGQELDLRYEEEAADENALLAIHKNKTGALLKASAWLGVCAAGANPEECAEITKYAENIGLTFQIVDDILDATANAAQLGKPVGSDEGNNKTTFVSQYGIQESHEKAKHLTEEAKRVIFEKYNSKSEFLCRFSDKLLARTF